MQMEIVFVRESGGRQLKKTCCSFHPADAIPPPKLLMFSEKNTQNQHAKSDSGEYRHSLVPAGTVYSTVH
jgi:hypothetical protein